MTTRTDSRPINQPTLADVLDMLPTVTDLSETRCKALTSDVRSFCKIVGLPADRVIASTPVLRQLAQQWNPAVKPISQRRWSNILSSLRKALHLTGIRETKFGLLPRPARAWQEFLSLITVEKRRIVFLRLARYCTAMAIIPEQVDDAIIRQFRQALDEEAFSDPAPKIACLCRAWNHYAASLPSWPQQWLTVPSQLRRYHLPWSAYPATLLSEIEHYLAQSLAPDPLDPNAPIPVRPSTAMLRKQLLRELASARVKRGTPAAEITGLGDLVRPAALKDALRFFLDRTGNNLTGHIMKKALLARSIARTFLRLPDAELSELDLICKPIRRCLRESFRSGLTEKNTRRLTQFRDQKNLEALLDLPQQLHSQARRCSIDLQSALRVQTALAIELFITTLLRCANIRGLSFSRHFVPTHYQGRHMIHLLLPAQEVKNSVDLEIPLLERTTVLLESYMDIYQPILSRGHLTDLLFPGLSGRPITYMPFSQRITDVILREIGIVMNLHLFRHLGALCYLNAHPGEYETVRRFLGHKSITTTINFYVGLETVTAFRRYDEVVLRLGTAHFSRQERNR
jgi:integrase